MTHPCAPIYCIRFCCGGAFHHSASTPRRNGRAVYFPTDLAWSLAAASPACPGGFGWRHSTRPCPRRGRRECKRRSEWDARHGPFGSANRHRAHNTCVFIIQSSLTQARHGWNSKLDCPCSQLLQLEPAILYTPLDVISIPTRHSPVALWAET